MRGYYIHFDGSKTPGVKKKIKMQTEELSRYFETEEIEITFVPKGLLWRLLRLLPGGGIERNYDSCFERMKEPDFVYIRRTLADKYYIRFLKRIRKEYPKCKILIEIFTYPYDKDEFAKWYTLPFRCKEKWNRRKIPQLIDRYVTVSKEDFIFGKQTIKIINGIFVDRVSLPSGEEKTTEKIDMLAVAYMQKQHGYERVIEGLHQYYGNNGKRQVHLHLVGDGPEKNRYQKLVKKYGLEEWVHFYPTLQGKELDDVYEDKDIAISALGLYKNHIDYESGLKTREYLSKGFPMITGCEIDIMEKGDNRYFCKFSNDASAIDIEKVVSFCDGVYVEGKSALQKEVRKFAKETVDMEIAMKPVVDFLLEE